MAIIARAEITLSSIRDLQSCTRYYLLQPSTASRPAKPTANPPGGSWVRSEPTYTAGSTDSLYFTDLNVFSDGDFSYSDVSLLSSYEASNLAYNTAVAAQSSIDGLQVGGRNFQLGTRSMEGWYTSSGFSRAQGTDGFAYMECPATDSPSWRSIRPARAMPYSELRGAECVASAEVWAAEDDGIRINLNIELTDSADIANGRIRYINISRAVTGTGAWQKISIPMTLTDEEFTGGTGTIDFDSAYVYIGAWASNQTTNALRLRKLKLEKGTIATDWTPAPEDADASISAVQAIADGKAVTFAQAGQPEAAGVGDLWIDTDDNNRMYRWSGNAWIDVAIGVEAGRNLILGGDRTFYSDACAASATNGSNGQHAPMSAYGRKLIANGAVDDKYTLTFDWKQTGTSTAGYFYTQLNGTTARLGNVYWDSETASGSISRTISLTAAQISAMTTTRTPGIRIVLSETSGDGPARVEITNVKLEYGQNATTWSHAPEDGVGTDGTNLLASERIRDGYIQSVNVGNEQTYANANARGEKYAIVEVTPGEVYTLQDWCVQTASAAGALWWGFTDANGIVVHGNRSTHSAYMDAEDNSLYLWQIITVPDSAERMAVGWTTYGNDYEAKLERGSVPTPWIAAPEDTEMDIATAQTGVGGAENAIRDVEESLHETQSTLQAWFTFDNTGLTISQPAYTDEEGVEHQDSIWSTLTDSIGFHIRRADLVDYVFSAYRDRCRVQNLEIGGIVMKPSSKGGMVWVKGG